MARKYAVPGSREFAWWYAQKRRRDRKVEEPGPEPPPEPTGLLVDYPGAAAAYSLRDLTGEEPTVVRVRRSDNNAEQDFTAAQIADGTLVAFVGAGNDGLVTTWYDQSGNDNHATQATAGNQPKIVDNGALVVENGKAALDFDGNDDFLSLGSGLPTNQNYTTFQVVKRNSSNTRSVFIGGLLALSPYSPFIFTDNNIYFRSVRGFVQSFLNTTDQKIFTGINIHTGAMSIYQNGINLVSSTPTNSPSDVNMTTIGRRSGDYGLGKTQEIIYYPSDQSANRVGIETNINDHYEIFS